MEESKLKIDFGGQYIVPAYIGNGEGLYKGVVSKKLDNLKPDKIFIIIDEFLFNNKLVDFDFFNKYAPVHICVAPNGENCKSLQNLSKFAEEILNRSCTKQSLIVGVGGGSTLNLAGLLGGLLYRGIQLLYFPTTFLAQHDVIPSRKTAINVANKKNNFGMYYSASAIFIDTDYVKSLPKLHFFSGLCELVKNAMILGGDSLDIVQEFSDAYMTNSEIIYESKWINHLVHCGISSKMSLLKHDATELREAILFEYGHTVGHAIEFVSGAPHGIAIMYGMLFCSFASFKLGYLPKKIKDEHDELIRNILGFAGAEAIPRYMDIEEVINKAINDNKRGLVSCEDNEITCVLLKNVSIPVKNSEKYLEPVSVDLLREWFLNEFSSHLSFKKKKLDQGCCLL